MSRNVRSLAFALLLVFVSASAVQALPLGEDSGRNLVSRMWSWIGELLSPKLKSVWETEGSSMDPNGVHGNNNLPAPTTDEGSQMDPNG